MKGHNFIDYIGPGLVPGIGVICWRIARTSAYCIYDNRVTFFSCVCLFVLLYLCAVHSLRTAELLLSWISVKSSFQACTRGLMSGPWEVRVWLICIIFSLGPDQSRLLTLHILKVIKVYGRSEALGASCDFVTWVLQPTLVSCKIPGMNGWVISHLTLCCPLLWEPLWKSYPTQPLGFMLVIL